MDTCKHLKMEKMVTYLLSEMLLMYIPQPTPLPLSIRITWDAGFQYERAEVGGGSGAPNLLCLGGVCGGSMCCPCRYSYGKKVSGFDALAHRHLNWNGCVQRVLRNKLQSRCVIILCARWAVTYTSLNWSCKTSIGRQTETTAVGIWPGNIPIIKAIWSF